MMLEKNMNMPQKMVKGKKAASKDGCCKGEVKVEDKGVLVGGVTQPMPKKKK